MTDRLKNKMLSSIDGTWLALHRANPGAGGAGELMGGGYCRQPANLVSCFDGERSNINSSVTFSDLPGDNVTYAALWDSKEGGSVLWPTALKSPISLSPGDGIEFSAGALSFSID